MDLRSSSDRLPFYGGKIGSVTLALFLCVFSKVILCYVCSNRHPGSSFTLPLYLVTSIAAPFSPRCRSCLPSCSPSSLTLLGKALLSHPRLAGTPDPFWLPPQPSTSVVQVSQIPIALCNHSPTLTLPCTNTPVSPASAPLPRMTLPVHNHSRTVNKLTVNPSTPVFCVCFRVHFRAACYSTIWPDADPADPD